MNTDLSDIIARIRALEQDMEREIEAELARKREQFRYRIEESRVLFERRVRQWHDQSRISSLRFLRNAGLRNLLVAPAIYSLIFPLIALDLGLWLYQAVCFPVYGMPKVDRSGYLVFDRGELAYLNWIERFNCAYCSYANGLMAYGREVAGRTEQYFCPIKHARRRLGAHSRYYRFFDFGDAEGFQRDREKLREELRRKP